MGTLGALAAKDASVEFDSLNHVIRRQARGETVKTTITGREE
ncbi:MAG TPA: hypothetical protein VJ836_05050 [Candidatus Saccharimonadales bacterium]|nr:hypothetical protein [Candidatus Saccharimonadales bacterium]